MEFAENLLDDDVENNSIWSYRYFLLNASPLGTYSKHASGTPEFVAEQLTYVMERRWTERMDNEAMWVYLRGLLASSEEEELASQSTKVKRSYILRHEGLLMPWLQNQCETYAEVAKIPNIEPTHLSKYGMRFTQILIVDLHLAKGETKEAAALLETLRDSTDRIRRNYWQWRIN